MIDLTQYTFTQLLQAMLLQVSDDVNKREGSLIRTALSPAAWVHEGLYIELANVQNQAFGQTASGDSLDYIAEMRGLKRKQPTPAIWKAAFNIPISAGERFAARDTTETIYYTALNDTVKEGSVYTCLVECEDAGTIGNTYNGALSPLTFIAGLISANLVSLESAGADIETDDELRERWRDGLVEIAFGGNVAAYREFVMAIDGVGACMIFPTWNGPGTVAVSVLDLNYEPCLPAKVEEIQKLICPEQREDGLGFAPIGASVKIDTPKWCDISVIMTIIISGRPIDDINADIRNMINEYFANIRRHWGNDNQNIKIYCNALLGRVVMIEGVVNVTNLFFRVNDEQQTEYAELIQNGAEQNIPRLAAMTIYEREQ